MFISPAEKTYSQTWAIRVAIVTMAVIAIGVMFLVVADSPLEKIPNAIWIAAVVVAGLALALCVAIGKTQLSIHSEGVRQITVFGEKELFWHDIKETRYKVTPIQLGAHFGLIGMAIQGFVNRQGGKSALVSQTLKLIGQDGRSIKITSNVANAKEAIATILGKIVPPRVADLNRRIQNGETAQFGPISVALAGVRWKSKDWVAFADISKAEIAGSNLKIGKRGKWLNYVSVGCHRVPDVIILLELIKVLTPARDFMMVDPLEHVRT